MLAEAAGGSSAYRPAGDSWPSGGDRSCSVAPPRCSDTGVPGCLSTMLCTALNPLFELIFCCLFMVPKIWPVQF